VRLAVAPLVLAGVASIGLLAATDLRSAGTALKPLPWGQAHYYEGCGGCHGLDGISARREIPVLRDSVGAFLCSAEGRRYIVRLPNVAFANMDDRTLADRLSRWLDRPVTTSRVHWRMLADVDRSTMEWEDHMVYGLGGEAVTKLLMDAAGPDRWGYRMPALTNAGELVAASARLPEEWREAVQGVAAIVSAAQHWSEAAREVDPFEPLLAIWSRGYGVLDVARHVTLLAPGLE